MSMPIKCLMNTQLGNAAFSKSFWMSDIGRVCCWDNFTKILDCTFAMDLSIELLFGSAANWFFL